MSFSRRRRSPGPAEGFNILCTRSSYHSDMGLDTMALAFQRLRQAGHDVTLTIVGRIPQDVRPQVSDPGGRSQGHLPRLHREGPAQGAHRPVRRVCRSVQGRPGPGADLSDQGAGIHGRGEAGHRLEDRRHRRADRGWRNRTALSAGDPADLAEKILSIKSDPERAARLGANARRASLGFDYAVKGQRILDALAALVA